MNRWQDRIAVVTGASSGIGKEILKQLHEHRIIVVGIARRVELIPQDKTKNIFAYKCDVSNEHEVKEVFAKIKEEVGPISILINNAGILCKSSFLDGNPQDWKRILDVNLFGTSICAHEAIKQMRENDDCGHVININSIAGHKVISCVPNHTAMYSSSKFGVTAFTEVLRQELRNNHSKIKTTSLSPGLVDTNIFEAGNIFKLTPEIIQQLPHLKPEDVAEGVIYVLGTKPHVQVHELLLKPLGENV